MDILQQVVALEVALAYGDKDVTELVVIQTHVLVNQDNLDLVEQNGIKIPFVMLVVVCLVVAAAEAVGIIHHLLIVVITIIMLLAPIKLIKFAQMAAMVQLE
jgi:hypothetical protein